MTQNSSSKTVRTIVAEIYLFHGTDISVIELLSQNYIGEMCNVFVRAKPDPRSAKFTIFQEFEYVCAKHPIVGRK